MAAGLLIQRLPIEGEGNLEPGASSGVAREEMEDAYNRISMLAATLTAEELLTLDSDTDPAPSVLGGERPPFRSAVPALCLHLLTRACGPHAAGSGQTGSGRDPGELGGVEIGCEFCGNHYVFDPVDVGELFTDPQNQAPGSKQVQ